MADYYYRTDERLSDLKEVWDYLYNNKKYHLCDIIRKEINTIKEY